MNGKIIDRGDDHIILFEYPCDHWENVVSVMSQDEKTIHNTAGYALMLYLT